VTILLVSNLYSLVNNLTVHYLALLATFYYNSVNDEMRFDMAKLSEDTKRIISEVHLAQVATASKDGRPNVSPRGSFRVLDDEHVIFTDGGRLYTLANLRENPQVSAVVYDVATRQGCRIWGTTEILESGDLFDIISTEAASRGRTVQHLVKVTVEEIVTF